MCPITRSAPSLSKIVEPQKGKVFANPVYNIIATCSGAQGDEKGSGAAQTQPCSPRFVTLHLGVDRSAAGRVDVNLAAAATYEISNNYIATYRPESPCSVAEPTDSTELVTDQAEEEEQPAARSELNEAACSDEKLPKISDTDASELQSECSSDSQLSSSSQRRAEIGASASKRLPHSFTSCHSSQIASTACQAGPSNSCSLQRSCSSLSAVRVHELLPAILVPLNLKGDCWDVAVLNASSACMSAMEAIEPGAEELVVEDSEALKILKAHIGHPVVSNPHFS